MLAGGLVLRAVYWTIGGEVAPDAVGGACADACILRIWDVSAVDSEAV